MKNIKKYRFLIMISLCLILIANKGVAEVFANPGETIVTEAPSDMPEGSGQIESDGGDGSKSFTSTLNKEVESSAVEEIEPEESISSVQEPFIQEEAPKKNYFFGYIILIMATITIVVGINKACKGIKQKEVKSKYGPDMMYNPMKVKLK